MDRERAQLDAGDAELTRRALLARAAAAGTAATVAADPLATAYAAHRRRRRRRRRHRHGASPSPSTPPARATFGTELEYYRSDPAHLETRLAACAAAGYRTIQTYVPWNVHEASRGTLDFSGATHPLIVHDHVDEYQIETPDQEIAAGGLPGRVVANTDLLGFIEACVRHGFELILRPGPFLSDEWRNGGLPDWLLDSYPGMFQLGPHGTALEPGLPFSPPASTVTGGGPLYYFSGPSYASADYLREVRRWLEQFAAATNRYLATRGGPVTSMQVDDEICFYYRFGPFEVDYHSSMVARFGRQPPTDWPAPGQSPAALRPALAWQRFKGEQLAVYLRFLADTLRGAGVDVPITHEEELQLSPPANFAQLAGAVDVLHPECYLDPGPWSQPTIELCCAAIRAAQRQRRDVISAEMSQNDAFIRHLMLGEGVTGFLGFSYTQGISDDAIPEMHVLARALRLAGSRIARSDRVADCAIVWPTEYLYAPYDATRYGFERDVRNVIERDIPALATLLIRAGLAFDLLDTDAAQAPDYSRYATIWLVAADPLPRSAQDALVAYVHGGGRLICWPAPPFLDEDYQPYAALADALYPDAPAATYPADNQEILLMGRPTTVYRGIQTFRLAPGSVAIGSRAGEPCGYARRHGRGEALLLGTWLAADSVPGREGDVFDKQGDQIVFDYSNERRGGEVLTGGTIARWDGENVVPLADINAATGVAQVTAIPFRPVTDAQIAAARALHARDAACAVSDRHAQARLLHSRDGAAATVSVVNRYEHDIDVAVSVSVSRGRGSGAARAAARVVRLPLAGTFKLPAGGSLLLPLTWELDHGVVVQQATVQLLDASIAPGLLRLSVWSAGGGEVVLALPGRRASASVDGRPAAVSRVRGRVGGGGGGGDVRIAVAAGERELQVQWR